MPSASDLVADQDQPTVSSAVGYHRLPEAFPGAAFQRLAIHAITCCGWVRLLFPLNPWQRL